jgi:hypothetical protein
VGASEWGDERPAERKGLPPWVLWGCGGGCLLLLLFAVGTMVLGAVVLRRAQDPERAWAGVAELLPHDARPEGWQAVGTSFFDVAFYFLRPPGPEAILVVQGVRSAHEAELLLAPESPDLGFQWFLHGVRNAEAGTLELQGRPASCLRFEATFSGPGTSEPFGARGLRIDVSAGGAPTVLHLFVAADESEAADARARELLEPFDLWRGR